MLIGGVGLLIFFVGKKKKKSRISVVHIFYGTMDLS